MLKPIEERIKMWCYNCNKNNPNHPEPCSCWDEKNLSSVEVYGRVFNTVLFRDENQANAFMGDHKEYGILCVEGDDIHLAKMEDKGEISQ